MNVANYTTIRRYVCPAVLILFVLFAPCLSSYAQETPSFPPDLCEPLVIEKTSLQKNLFFPDESTQNIWTISHSQYDIELPAGIYQLSILRVPSEGMHESIEQRARDIADRIYLAWYLMYHGWYLTVKYDQSDTLFKPAWNTYRKYPSIYVANHKNCFQHRIMTIFEEDINYFGLFPEFASYNDEKKMQGIAYYIMGQLKSHYLLFIAKSNVIGNYEDTGQNPLDCTRSGKIYKEMFLRTQEYISVLKLDTFTMKHLRDTLARIDVDQRNRIHLLSGIIPRDWTERTCFTAR